MSTKMREHFFPMPHFSRQGCQIFLGTKYQTGKIYRMATKYTKWPLNISNGRKIDQKVIK
jgi:hypothetical protein